MYICICIQRQFPPTPTHTPTLDHIQMAAVARAAAVQTAADATSAAAIIYACMHAAFMYTYVHTYILVCLHVYMSLLRHSIYNGPNCCSPSTRALTSPEPTWTAPHTYIYIFTCKRTQA